MSGNTRMKRLGLGLLACMLAMAGARASADISTADWKLRTNLLYDQATNAFWWGDFEEMTRLYELHKAPAAGSEFGPDTAYHRLRLVRNGFGNVLNGDRADGDAYYAELCALTLQWARQHPDSALAHVLHARALTKRAWKIRGGGYTKEVPPQAWEDFHAYIKQAGDYLAANAKVAFTDSSAHSELILIGQASDWPVERLWSIAQEGLKINPNDRKLYLDVLTAALPKWGGSAELVDRYIAEVLAQTKDRWGMEMYAILYSSAAEEQFGHQLFRDSLAKWPKMKEGLEQRIKRDGIVQLRNRLAYFACMAQDRPTLLEQLEAMGDEKPHRPDWGNNPQVTYDTCKRWAFKS